MSNKVTVYVLDALADDAKINGEILRTTMFLVEKWKRNVTIGADQELADLLESEVFNDDSMQIVRNLLIGYASHVESDVLFAQTIKILGMYHDDRDTLLFQYWLLEKTSSLLEQNRAVWSLFNVLVERGEGITERHSLGTSDIEQNLADIRRYVDRVFGVRLPSS